MKLNVILHLLSKNHPPFRERKERGGSCLVNSRLSFLKTTEEAKFSFFFGGGDRAILELYVEMSFI